MAGRTSLKDIAAATGMSVSTVSLALSGDLRVSAQTRQRIRAAADKLGYVRDPILASIASGRFRHPGKPVSIAISGENGAWIAKLRPQAEAMGMSVRGIDGPIETLATRALELGSTALVLNRRGVDLELVAHSPLPVVLWEDEGPANPPVDLVETCEWWTATVGAIERIRAAGYRAPAALLTPATPRHWHDDIRLAAVKAMGLPVLELVRSARDDGDGVAAFVAEHRPDAMLVGLAGHGDLLQRCGVKLPYAALIVHEGPWFAHIAGWMPDQDHRGQVTLELIEQRLRYGPRSPRRIVIPPRWQVGQTLPGVG
jgi:DNA-binding LacI/PurR family transcriptional regulator